MHWLKSYLFNCYKNNDNRFPIQRDLALISVPMSRLSGWCVLALLSVRSDSTSLAVCEGSDMHFFSLWSGRLWLECQFRFKQFSPHLSITFLKRKSPAIGTLNTTSLDQFNDSSLSTEYLETNSSMTVQLLFKPTTAALYLSRVYTRKHKIDRHYTLPVIICTQFMLCTTRDDLVEGALKNDAEKNIKN